MQGLDGQLTTYKAYLGSPHPCLRCLFDEETGEDALPSCAQGGVLGAVAGVLGTLQAVEVIKELAGIGTSLSGTLLLYDAAAASSSESIWPPRRLHRRLMRAGPGLSSGSCRDWTKFCRMRGLRVCQGEGSGCAPRDRLR